MKWRLLAIEILFALMIISMMLVAAGADTNWI